MRSGAKPSSTRRARLFAKTGFLGASVADLAAACATSKSLIYHYYPSKEDILFAVMSSHLDQLCEDVAAVTAMPANPAEQLCTLVHRFVQHYVGASNRQKVLLNELDNLPSDRRSAIVTKQRVILDTVQDLLIALKPSLLENPPRARVHTMMLFGMINWMHTWFDSKGAISADEVADMVLSLIAPGTERERTAAPATRRVTTAKPTPAVRRRNRG